MVKRVCLFVFTSPFAPSLSPDADDLVEVKTTDARDFMTPTLTEADRRRSAISLGVVSCSIILSVVGVTFLLDLGTICRHITALYRGKPIPKKAKKKNKNKNAYIELTQINDDVSGEHEGSLDDSDVSQCETEASECVSEADEGATTSHTPDTDTNLTNPLHNPDGGSPRVNPHRPHSNLLRVPPVRLRHERGRSASCKKHTTEKHPLTLAPPEVSLSMPSLTPQTTPPPTAPLRHGYPNPSAPLRHGYPAPSARPSWPEHLSLDVPMVAPAGRDLASRILRERSARGTRNADPISPRGQTGTGSSLRVAGPGEAWAVPVDHDTDRRHAGRMGRRESRSVPSSPGKGGSSPRLNKSHSLLSHP